MINDHQRALKIKLLFRKLGALRNRGSFSSRQKHYTFNRKMYLNVFLLLKVQSYIIFILFCSFMLMDCSPMWLSCGMQPISVCDAGLWPLHDEQSRHACESLIQPPPFCHDSSLSIKISLSAFDWCVCLRISTWTQVSKLPFKEWNNFVNMK